MSNEPEKKEQKEIKNKKIITTFEYKSYVNELVNENIIYSEDNNNINFISLNLLLSKINDNNLNDSNKNIKYNDILLYIAYQKNVLMTTEIFLNIIESFIADHKIKCSLILLNAYLTNYYTEIFTQKEILEKVISLYQSTNLKEITFNNEYEDDKTIEISELIKLINYGDGETIKKLSGMESIRISNEPPDSIIPKSLKITDKHFDIFSWDPIEIARQITIYTQYLYRNIECKELLLAGWTKKDKMTNSPNISYVIERFNSLSRWIMEEILSYDFAKDRSRVVEQFILIAQELKNMNNFNDCFTVVTCFNQLCVKRLRKTWNYVNPEYKTIHQDLSNLCSILKNFEKIKSAYTKYEKNIKKKSDIKEGCIPYLATYLKDLAFLEEAHKYFNDNKLLNIIKINIVGKNIKNIKNSQLFVYSYRPVYALSFLSEPHALDDGTLTSLSEALEPKFRLTTKRTRQKRLTNTENFFNLAKRKLNDSFLKFVEDYSNSFSKTISLEERIDLYNNQFILNHQNDKSVLSCIEGLEKINETYDGDSSMIPIVLTSS